MMKSVGLRLQQAREAQGMSIEDVARITRISRSVIAAIETNDSATLPADVYVRGFSRNIAVVLGLDPAELIQSRSAVEPEVIEPLEASRREEQRFAMLFGHGPSDVAQFGRAPLIMAMVAIGLFFSAWLLVGDQSTPQETALELENGVPAIQQHVDAVTPFTAQGLRADARR
ncbi:MAG: helix-turn-helix domain-containing protein [Myxococcota bacterium]